MSRSSVESHESANLHKYSSDNAFYQKHLYAFLDEVHARIQQAGARTVLDAGCGEGFVVDYLAKKDPSLQLTGLDISEGAIAYANAHFGDQATFRTGSLFDLPFEEGQFDLVLCSEVLEHLDTPDPAVEELKRVARTHVLITVPREPYFQWLNNVGQWLGLSPDPEHVNFWTKASFQAFVRSHFSEVAFGWKHIYQLALARA